MKRAGLLATLVLAASMLSSKSKAQSYVEEYDAMLSTSEPRLEARQSLRAGNAIIRNHVDYNTTDPFALTTFGAFSYKKGYSFEGGLGAMTRQRPHGVFHLALRRDGMRQHSLVQPIINLTSEGAHYLRLEHSIEREGFRLTGAAWMGVDAGPDYAFGPDADATFYTVSLGAPAGLGSMRAVASTTFGPGREDNVGIGLRFNLRTLLD